MCDFGERLGHRAGAQSSKRRSDSERGGREGDAGFDPGGATFEDRSAGPHHPRPGDGSAGDKFGYAVAVDGSTALVGAYAASGSQGAAYVYTTSAGTWSQQTKLQASDGKANDDFGYSVSLSGTRALVGAYEIAASGDPGAAYVFTNSSGTWSQQELSAPIPGQSFGSAVALSGTGAAAGTVTMTPVSVNFGEVAVGTTSSPLPIAVANNGASAIPITNWGIGGPFMIFSNACGTTTLAANSSCQVALEFQPTQSGAAAGTLTLTDGAGTQTLALNGTGAAPPTDTLNPTSITFPATAVGQLSAAQSVTLTNSGNVALTGIATSVSAGFQTSTFVIGWCSVRYGICLSEWRTRRSPIRSSAAGSFLR